MGEDFEREVEDTVCYAWAAVDSGGLACETNLYGGMSYDTASMA